MSQDISEFSQRLLAALEEFPRDNVFAMLNTIVDPAGDDSELRQFIGAISELIDLDFASLGYESAERDVVEELTAEDSRALARTLNEWFKFNGVRWTLRAGDINRSRIPIIRITGAGLARARSILDRRGYEWWHPRAKPAETTG